MGYTSVDNKVYVNIIMSEDIFIIRACTIDEIDDRKINRSIDDNRCQLID